MKDSHDYGSVLDEPNYHQPDNSNTFKILLIVKGVLNFFIAIFFGFYAGMGMFFGKLAENDFRSSTDFDPGNLFVTIGIIGMVLSIVFGILTIYAGISFGKHKNYTFIFVMALLNALSGVLGVVLVVFVIIELTKPHVKQRFDLESQG